MTTGTRGAAGGRGVIAAAGSGEGEEGTGGGLKTVMPAAEVVPGEAVLPGAEVVAGAGAGVVAGEAVWSAAGRFATGVCVVTAGSGPAVHGSTASTFTFISRRPPLVALSLRHGSHLLALIAEHRDFGINVLSSRQAALARHFASRKRAMGTRQFDGVGWAPAAGGLPRLAGTVCWLHCRAQRLIPAGDHEIVLAEVASVAEAGGSPLLYFAGALHPGSIPSDKE
ncbi:flavin reductase family protein [Streptomyces sp. NPDC021096]|uniref:flavin reductase family protein n=1 Tax=Streptomyces sp. NPDC021096 TaxID=3154792 RepID=UPI0033FA76CE